MAELCLIFGDGPAVEDASGKRLSVAMPHRQAWRTLAYLCLQRNRPVTRDELAEALWAERLPATWEAALRVNIKKVRDFLSALGLDGRRCLRSASGCYELDMPQHVADDHHEALAALERAAKAPPAEALLDAETAVRLTSGNFLPGEEAAWIDDTRHELRRAHLRALEIESDAALRTGDVTRAVRSAEDAVAADPVRESAYRLLMQAHDASGDRAQALGVYERLRSVLADELGADPSSETQDLHLQLLRAEGPITASTPQPLPGPLRLMEPAFVAREKELTRLREGLLRSRRGALQLFVIAGDPGIGKTRLVSEVARSAHDEGASVLYGRCDEDPISPFQPFAEALSRLSLADFEAEREFPRELAALIPGRRDTSTREDTPNIDPQLQRFRLFEAVAGLIVRCVAGDAGLVLVLDDLHWADRPTLLLLEHLVRSKADAPMLVLGTYRGGEPPRALGDLLADVRRSNVLTELRLEGLDVGETTGLIHGWSAPSTTTFARALHERTDGNPFFVLEILRHLEEGAEEIELRPHDLDTAGIPAGVRDVIHRRLDRLSEGAQDVLLTASIIGRHFDLVLTERVLDGGLDVPVLLEEAAKAGLINEAPDALGQYQFAHHLVRQVLYEDLSATRRARLHQRVGEALEKVVGERPELRATELAHHFVTAAPIGDTRKATRYAELAGDRALQTLAFEDAASHYEDALAFVDDDVAARARLSISLADAKARAGDPTSAWATLHEALPSAQHAGLLEEFGDALVRTTSSLATNWDPAFWDACLRSLDRLGEDDSPLRSIVLSRMALMAQIFGAPLEKQHRAMPLGVEAHEMAERTKDPTALAAAIQARILCDPTAELLPRRLELLRELLRLSTETADEPLKMNTYLWLAIEHLSRGDVANARSALDDFNRLGAATGHPWTEWRRLVAQATWQFIEGDLDGTSETNLRAFRAGRDAQVPQAFGYYADHTMRIRGEQGRLAEIEAQLLSIAEHAPELRTGVAFVCAELGRLDEARKHFDSLAADGFASVPMKYPGWPLTLRALAHVCDTLGDADRAQVLYDKLEPYAGRHLVGSGFGGYADPVDLPLGALAATMGNAAGAERHLLNALEMCDAVGARMSKARTQLRLAKVILDQDPRRARGLLDDALAAAQRIGMNRVLAQIKELH